jgi:hypothetical protein
MTVIVSAPIEKLHGKDVFVARQAKAHEIVDDRGANHESIVRWGPHHGLEPGGAGASDRILDESAE